MTYECCFYKFLSSYHLMGKRVSPNTWGQPYFSSLSIWILLPYKHASLHIITNTLDAEFHKIDKLTVFHKIEKLKTTLISFEPNWNLPFPSSKVFKSSEGTVNSVTLFPFRIFPFYIVWSITCQFDYDLALVFVLCFSAQKRTRTLKHI